MLTFDLPVGAFVDVMGHRLEHLGGGRFSCRENDMPQIIEGFARSQCIANDRIAVCDMPDTTEDKWVVVWFCDRV